MSKVKLRLVLFMGAILVVSYGASVEAMTELAHNKSRGFVASTIEYLAGKSVSGIGQNNAVNGERNHFSDFELVRLRKRNFRAGVRSFSNVRFRNRITRRRIIKKNTLRKNLNRKFGARKQGRIKRKKFKISPRRIIVRRKAARFRGEKGLREKLREQFKRKRDAHAIRRSR